MIYIGHYEELAPNRGYDSMKVHLSPAPYDGQNRIIDYLKQGNERMFSLKKPVDVFTNERIKTDLIAYSDGKYVWWNILAYYVEKYNLRLPEEFENHILNSK